MARIIIPGPETTGRLVSIARAAFDGPQSGWTADDFLALGGPPHAALITDDTFSTALLAMRMVADEAEILNFGVIPAARRRGLGRALLRAAQQVARQHGIARIFLEVAVTNVAARSLYVGGGFSEAGRRPGYYLRPDGTRVDALILSHRL